MVNLEYTKVKFYEYIKEYNLNDKRIQLKISHMVRVMNLNMKFAEYQNLDKMNIELAGIIGILHDIGRFVQVKNFNTFIDSQSINHTDAGIKLLFEEGLIRKFIKEDTYDYIIKKAIQNHGRFEIENNLDETTLMHCKLIRDADKTDIYEVMLQEDPYLVFDGEYDINAQISPLVLESFYNKTMIRLEDRKTVFDDYIRKVAFIFNYYFEVNLKYVFKKDYINSMKNRFLRYFKLENKKSLENIEKVTQIANEYLSEINDKYKNK